MTVCNTGGKKNNHRQRLPSTPFSSCCSERCCPSKTKMPLHASFCSMPRRHDHRFSCNKQFIVLEAQGGALCTTFPLLSNVNDVEPTNTLLSVAVPSLRLKPRTRLNGARTTIRPRAKASISWQSKTTALADAALLTPGANKIVSPGCTMDYPHHPFRERSETQSKFLVIFGESLLKHNGTKHVKAQQYSHAVFCKEAPKLQLKPRHRMPPSASTTNKKNLNGRTKLPFLSPLP